MSMNDKKAGLGAKGSAARAAFPKEKRCARVARVYMRTTLAKREALTSACAINNKKKTR